MTNTRTMQHLGLATAAIGLTLAGCQVLLPVGAPKSTFRLEKWEKLNTGVTETLYDLHFVDAQTGYVVGDKGLVLKTADAGKTWQASRPAVMANKKLEKVAFASPEVGCVLHGSEVFRTADGGNTWQRVMQSSDGVDKSSRSSTDGFLSIKFSSPTDGWLGRYQSLFKSTDGGATWQKANAPETTGEFRAIATHGGNAWFSERNSVYRYVPTVGLVSIGLGLNRIAANIQSSGGAFSFISENEGWGVQPDISEIHKTTDGGKSWQTIKPKTMDGLVVGYPGGLPGFAAEVGLDFVNGERGWLSYHDSFYSTYDGGLSWYDQNFGRRDDATRRIQGLQMFSDANGYVVGLNGMVKKFSGQFDTEVKK